MPDRQPPKKKMRLDPESVVEASSDASTSSSSATSAAARASAQTASSLPPSQRRGRRSGGPPIAVNSDSDRDRDQIGCGCLECRNMPSGSNGPSRHSPNCLCNTCEAAEVERQAWRSRRREGHFPTALNRLSPVEGREAILKDVKALKPIRWSEKLGFHLNIDVWGARNFEEIDLSSSSSSDIVFYSSDSSSS